MNNDHQDARMIVALAAEADDRFIWDRIRALQTEMFAAGPVQIKFAYFGREGALQTRPYIATRWVTDADAMADIMDRGRAGCVCGCFIQIGDILEQALREARQRPIQAVVIVGDHFHGSLDDAVAKAKQLRAAGTRLFLLQQGRSGPTEDAFRTLAEVTGGAYVQFNPHIERVRTLQDESVIHLAARLIDASHRRDQIARRDGTNIFAVLDVEVRLQPGFRARHAVPDQRLEIVAHRMEPVVLGSGLHGAPHIAS